MSDIQYLAEKNTHPRDKRITFEEGPHIYTIDGIDNKIANYTSVTTWNHTHFEKFDADKIITNMMRSKKWPQSKYFGKTREEIKAEWDKNGDEASKAGTKMHYDIECFYNNMDVEVDEDNVEWNYFENFEEDYGRNMKPYRTEWMVFHEELKFAGSIDMVYENDDGSLCIYDWKRCKEIKQNNSWGKCAITDVINHLPDTNYWTYCLQLNIYKAILEEKYNKKVTDLYLVCLHPNNQNKNYQRIKVADLQKEVKELFKLRKAEIASWK